MYLNQRSNFISRAWDKSYGPNKHKSLYSAVNNRKIYQLQNAEK